MPQATQGVTHQRSSMKQINYLEPPRILAIGAHPDDLELGAGGFLSRCRELGSRIDLLILTDEGPEASHRRMEAIGSAGRLGLQTTQVHFAHLQDGFLRANRSSVGLIRQLAAERGLQPSIIVTHSQADSHNDHVEASRLAHAAFRGCVILHFPIHISAETTTFRPTLFLQMTSELLLVRDRALSCHQSQLSRLSKNDLRAFQDRFGRSVGLQESEAFEVVVQEGACASDLRWIEKLNDSTFNQFWSQICTESDDKAVLLVYSGASDSHSLGPAPAIAENRGRDALRHSFENRSGGQYKLREVSSESININQVLGSSETLLLVGGAVSNRHTRYLDGLQLLPWAIEYEMPRSAAAFLRNREIDRQIKPKIGKPIVLVSLAPHPNLDRDMLVVAGTDGRATEEGLKLIAESETFEEFRNLFAGSRQIAIEFDVESGDRTLLSLTGKDWTSA